MHGGGTHISSGGRINASLAAPPAVHAALTALLAADKRLALDPNAPPGRTVLMLSGTVASGFDALEVTYEENMLYIIDLSELEKKNPGYFRSHGISLTEKVVRHTLTADRIVKELGLDGRAYMKKVNGVWMMVLYGNQNLRAVLTSNKYKVRNPKMIQFAVGAVGRAGDAFKGITHIAVVVAAGDAIVQAFLRDEGASDAIARFLTGIPITLTAAVIGQGAALGTTFVTTSILAPFVVGLAVALAAGYGLDKLDEEFGLTEMLKEHFKSLRPSGPADPISPPLGDEASVFRTLG